jgi:hypothetical protein
MGFVLFYKVRFSRISYSPGIPNEKPSWWNLQGFFEINELDDNGAYGFLRRRLDLVFVSRELSHRVVHEGPIRGIHPTGFRMNVVNYYGGKDRLKAVEN